jgi:hypothetical protein
MWPHTLGEGTDRRIVREEGRLAHGSGPPARHARSALEIEHANEGGHQ